MQYVQNFEQGLCQPSTLVPPPPTSNGARDSSAVVSNGAEATSSPSDPPPPQVHRRHLPPTMRRPERPRDLASSTACTPFPATLWISMAPSRSSRTSPRQVACGICGTSASHWSPAALYIARISRTTLKPQAMLALAHATPRNPSPTCKT